MKWSFKSPTNSSQGYCKGYKFEVSWKEEKESIIKLNVITKSNVSSSGKPGYCTEVWFEITIGSQTGIRFVWKGYSGHEMNEIDQQWSQVKRKKEYVMTQSIT